ncbi:hypothetical protein F5877DRAFT_4636, partial [Lentinula edodes]
DLGSTALVDVKSVVPLVEIMIAMTDDVGTLVTQNPVHSSVSEDGQLRLYWLLDPHFTLYVYAAQAQNSLESGDG